MAFTVGCQAVPQEGYSNLFSKSIKSIWVKTTEAINIILLTFIKVTGIEGCPSFSLSTNEIENFHILAVNFHFQNSIYYRPRRKRPPSIGDSLNNVNLHFHYYKKKKVKQVKDKTKTEPLPAPWLDTSVHSTPQPKRKTECQADRGEEHQAPPDGRVQKK